GRDAHRAPQLRQAPVLPRWPPVGPVAALRHGRGRLPGGIRRLLRRHPGAVAGTGRCRAHGGGDRQLPRRRAGREARRPVRPQADVVAERCAAGGVVPRLAVHRHLPAVHRARGGDGGGGESRRGGPRRLRPRRAAARRARRVPGLHVLRAQRGLQSRSVSGRRRYRFRCRRAALGPGRLHGPLRGQRGGDPPAAGRLPRRPIDRAPPPAGGAAGHPQPQLAPGDLPDRRAVVQPGAPPHGDPAVAGHRDRRSPRARGAALRHQHRDVHRAAPGDVARHPRHRHRPARGAPLRGLLRAHLRRHARHSRDRRLGHGGPVLRRPHRPDVGRALSVRLGVDLRGRADGSPAARGLPGRLRARQHARPVLGAGRLWLPCDGMGRLRLARHRRHRRRRGGCHAPGDTRRAALPREARPARCPRRRPCRCARGGASSSGRSDGPARPRHDRYRPSAAAL
ncbi:MAG: Putative membrane transport protein, partial [uncultured Nocardioides sp.]